MATITQIREGIAANLRALDGFQISAYELTNPTPPTIWVIPGDVNYDRAMHRGLDEIEMLVQALVVLSADIGSQVRIDELLAPTGATSHPFAKARCQSFGRAVSRRRRSRCNAGPR